MIIEAIQEFLEENGYAVCKDGYSLVFLHTQTALFLWDYDPDKPYFTLVNNRNQLKGYHLADPDCFNELLKDLPLMLPPTIEVVNDYLERQGWRIQVATSDTIDVSIKPGYKTLISFSNNIITTLHTNNDAVCKTDTINLNEPTSILDLERLLETYSRC